ncbi:hypothetical protein NQ314_003874 [Rhamnusium bicolor]|uniref:PiggyBac transposable element-derived protein domain-containing protein n=1 Tax=Rhamnusium bicolor TaxID=1586634 RepID=A0AAV8ZKZ9_9CUCU|nr:hypothetical protein NQ314_003874 [Rhamnusium bicolor]
MAHDIGRLLENNNDVNTENLFTDLDDVNNEILLLGEEIDSDEEPLSRIAKKLRATVPQAVWSKQNFYQEPPTFDLAHGVDIDEVIELSTDVFLCLFPEVLLQTIVFHTNFYATQKHTNKGNKIFKLTTIKEIKMFLGVNLLMGIKKLPSLKDCWSSQKEVRDAFISKVIPRGRFYWLLSCGTLRKGKKYLPDDFIEDKRLSRGQCDWQMTQYMLVCLKWKDKYGTLQELSCPRQVADYNKHMGSANKADILKKFYAIDRKRKKLYHRIVWHFLDTTVVNAYILFQKENKWFNS